MPKYIIIELKLNEFGISFPEMVDHDFTKYTLGADAKVIGAGFFKIGVEDGVPSLSCYGESVSLKIKSRGFEDAIILKHSLFDRYSEVKIEK